MNITYAPFVEPPVNETFDFNHNAATVTTPAGTLPLNQAQSGPNGRYFQSTRPNWINAPFYHIPQPKQENAALAIETASETDTNVESTETTTGSENTDNFEPFRQEMQVDQASPLAGFDLNQLEPSLLEIARESAVAHTQTVIAFFQKGGEQAKMFGKMFLTDLAMQKSVLNELMGAGDNQGNVLGQLNALQKELALRLATCGQARQVAHLLLAEI